MDNAKVECQRTGYANTTTQARPEMKTSFTINTVPGTYKKSKYLRDLQKK